MKVRILFFFIVALSFCACEREIDIHASDVPSGVLNEFNGKYSDGKDADWRVGKEKDGFYYEVIFTQAGEKKLARFKTDGTFVNEENKK